MNKNAEDLSPVDLWDQLTALNDWLLAHHPDALQRPGNTADCVLWVLRQQWSRLAAVQDAQSALERARTDFLQAHVIPGNLPSFVVLAWEELDTAMRQVLEV